MKFHVSTANIEPTKPIVSVLDGSKSGTPAPDTGVPPSEGVRHGAPDLTTSAGAKPAEPAVATEDKSQAARKRLEAAQRQCKLVGALYEAGRETKDDRDAAVAELKAAIDNSIAVGPSDGVPVFGPVIERTVESVVSGKSAIDLDTGELYTGPQVVKDAKALEDWMKSTGVDALGMAESLGLGGFDMVAMPANNSRWDISTAELQQTLAIGKPGTPAMMSGKGELPQTYLFKTREGGMGVLQIVGFNDKPWAVNVRYKLLRKPVPAVAAALSDLYEAITHLFSDAHHRGDAEAEEKIKREMAATTKQLVSVLQGTIAERACKEWLDHMDALRKAAADKDPERIEKLREQSIADAMTLDRLVRGNGAPAPAEKGPQNVREGFGPLTEPPSK